MADDIVYKKEDWAWWKARLAGLEPAAHPDIPMQGYYRYRTGKDKPYLPVAVWYENGTAYCQVNGKQADVGHIWPHLIANPVAYKTYQAVLAGGPWPDEVRVQKPDGKTESSHTKPVPAARSATVGDNSGADPFVAFSGDIDEWIREAEKAIALGTPKTKEEADSLTDIRTKLADLKGDADNKRKELTKPHRDAEAKVNAKWNPVIKKAESAMSRINPLIAAFQAEEKKRREQVAQKIVDEAGGDVRVSIAPVRTGTRRTVGTVKRSECVIEDLAKVAAMLAGLKEPPAAFKEACRQAAYNLLVAGVEVPGAKLQQVSDIRG